MTLKGVQLAFLGMVKGGDAQDEVRGGGWTGSGEGQGGEEGGKRRRCAARGQVLLARWRGVSAGEPLLPPVSCGARHRNRSERRPITMTLMSQ